MGDSLAVRFLRRFVATALTYLPWTCHGMLLAWGEIGGWRLLVRGLAPWAARQCPREAARDGDCYCQRFVTVEHLRHVYVSTRYEAHRES